MSNPEYHMLPSSPYEAWNFNVSVAFEFDQQKGIRPSMPNRDVDLRYLLNLIRPEPFPMDFDEHPFLVTRISIDLAKRKAKIQTAFDPSLK